MAKIGGKGLLLTKIIDGWLNGTDSIVSPNADKRPVNVEPSLLVIHNISLPPGQFGGSEICDFFTNKLDCSTHPFFETLEKVRVSAHLLIDRQGQVTQFVSFSDRAWHAGVSSFRGRDRCNDFSIGIELEGTDVVPYTESQYLSLAQVVAQIMKTYPLIRHDCIVGHSDIAPGRKTDPGEVFDWQRFRTSVENRRAD